MKIAFRCLPIALAALFATPIARAEGAAEIKPTEQPPTSQRDAPKRGGLFTLRSGVLVPAGNFADGLPVSDFGPGESFTATLGVFVTPTIGILAGARGSFGHRGFADCKDARSSSSKCGGITLQVPLLLEFAPTGRTRGFFADAGVGLLTTYSAYAEAYDVLGVVADRAQARRRLPLGSDVPLEPEASGLGLRALCERGPRAVLEHEAALGGRLRGRRHRAGEKGAARDLRSRVRGLLGIVSALRRVVRQR